jgi:hypothetical protein
MDMSIGKVEGVTHPVGEMKATEPTGEQEGCTIESYAGKVHLRWDETAAVTTMGQMPVFVDFLKTSGLWDGFVGECPLSYKSPNAPSHVDILGTLMMSVLAGQCRYAHINGLRGDGVNPELLGMRKVMSEDSARRAFQHASPEQTREWLQKHLRQTYEPLLKQAWVMDLDSTVKPLYGKQEKAVKGYNAVKPGRPSHVIHTYLIAELRLVLGAEVQAGNETASSYAQLLEILRYAAASVAPSVHSRRCGMGQRAHDAGSRTARSGVFVQDSAKREDQRTAGQQLRDAPMAPCRSRMGGHLE